MAQYEKVVYVIIEKPISCNKKEKKVVLNIVDNRIHLINKVTRCWLITAVATI